MKAAFKEPLLSFHHSICSAALNQCVKQCLKSDPGITNILTTCRSIVGRFKHSNKAFESLKHLQDLLDVPAFNILSKIASKYLTTPASRFQVRRHLRWHAMYLITGGINWTRKLLPN
ncbi:hypothetical protein ACQ4LE_003407 [Meloidogyne hapla]